MPPKTVVEDKQPTGGNKNTPPGKLDLSKYNLDKDGKRIDPNKPQGGKPVTSTSTVKDDDKKKKKEKEKEKEEEEAKKKEEEEEKKKKEEEEAKKKDDKGGSEDPKKKTAKGSGNAETQGNTIGGDGAEKAKREAFSKKPEQGDLELRKWFVKMSKCVDLVMKAGGGEDMEDDRTKFGGVRPLGKDIDIDKENEKEFEDAPNESIWLGFVRIGRRVGQKSDELTLIQITDEPDKLKYAFPAKALSRGGSWHLDYLEKHLSKPLDPAVKSWNGWKPQELKPGKFDLVDTGCFFGFFLIKAKDGGDNHYLNFACTTLNQAANAVFSDKVPALPESKMSPVQKAAYRNLVEAERTGFGVDMKELESAFRGVKLERGVLDNTGSKKMPLSWAKLIYDALKSEG